MGSGKWEVGSGKWEVGSGKWEVGSGKLYRTTILYLINKSFFYNRLNIILLFLIIFTKTLLLLFETLN